MTILIVAVITVIVITLLLPHIIHQQNIKHLGLNNCSVELYDIIHKVKKHNPGSETIRVETSTKITPSGKHIRDRYVIPILLSEWNTYTVEQQSSILKKVGFSRSQLHQITDNHKEQIGKGTDIILGQEGNKGKIYLDFDSMELVCYEQGQPLVSPTKTYKPEGNNGSDTLIVRDNNDNILGTHKRVNINKDIYWISNLKSGTSYYTRPPKWVLFLSELTDVAKILAPFAF